MQQVILRYVKGMQATKELVIPLAEFSDVLLGRDPGATLRFDLEYENVVGRRHAHITRDALHPYRFTLIDLNSRNGTFLNNLRVMGEAILRPGDVIQLGAGGPQVEFEIDPVPPEFIAPRLL